jgi:hypothetical protein
MIANQLQRSACLAELSLSFDDKAQAGCHERGVSVNDVSIGINRCEPES